MKSREKVDAVESQIERLKQNIDYDTRDFTLEIIVSKYLNRIDDDDNEIYVPDYQRDFIWSDKHQSRFVESLLLGLPVPLMFVVEIPETGRLEVVDGSQRLRTLEAFLSNRLKLQGLKSLNEVNGFYFEDFPTSRQRKIRNTPIRMIILSSKATEEVRIQMFDRINTSSVPLAPMELRKGAYRGSFNDFLFECAENSLFVKLCPIYKYFEGRQEHAELALRFFAFSETYPKFEFDQFSKLGRHGVTKYLDDYLIYQNSHATDSDFLKMKVDFHRMLEFVDQTFSTFGRGANANATSRPYFEALAVGSHLALIDIPMLRVSDISWTQNIEIERYQTHKPNKLKGRINYVHDQLVKRNEKI